MTTSEPPDPAKANELEQARVAENELAFLALLRTIVNGLMHAHGVESIADLPYASRLLRRAVEECAVAKGIQPHVAQEIARRQLGFP